MILFVQQNMPVLPRKVLLFLFYVLSTNTLIFGQGIISGVIRDEHSGLGLEFATVFVPEYPYFTETDGNGKFELKVPALKKCIIKVSRVGYISQVTHL